MEETGFQPWVQLAHGNDFPRIPIQPEPQKVSSSDLVTGTQKKEQRCTYKN